MLKITTKPAPKPESVKACEILPGTVFMDEDGYVFLKANTIVVNLNTCQWFPNIQEVFRGYRPVKSATLTIEE